MDVRKVNLKKFEFFINTVIDNDLDHWILLYHLKYR